MGFGGFRDGLEALAGHLGAGDLEAARAAARRGRPRAAWLAAFLDGLEDPDAYRAAARGMTDRIAWAGRLDHAELADLLPAAEAMAVTSTFPEAFGMVAAEAAACGALPVVADHSGLGRGRARARRGGARARARRGSRSRSARARSRSSARPTGWLAAPADLRAAHA